MYPIKETRKVNMYSPMTCKNELKISNVCLTKDNKEIVYHGDGYYYVNKNNMLSSRRCKQ